MRHYKLTVIGCALAWFFVGLHVPALHRITGHGETPSWSVLLATTLLVVTALTTLWALLRNQRA